MGVRIKIIPKPEIKRYVEVSMDIADKIYSILEENNISTSEFAEKVNEDISTINKWLSGAHNFDIKTLTKIETKLCKKLLHIN